MTDPATTTDAAAAASPVLGPNPTRASSAPAGGAEFATGGYVAAVDPVVDVDGPPLPTVAVYEDEDGRTHYASPFSKATREYVAAGEWTEVDSSAGPFDPTLKLVRDVIAYLQNHADDQAEVDRVKAAEAAGENRRTIRDWTPEQ